MAETLLPSFNDKLATEQLIMNPTILDDIIPINQRIEPFIQKVKETLEKLAASPNSDFQKKAEELNTELNTVRKEIKDQLDELARTQPLNSENSNAQSQVNALNKKIDELVTKVSNTLTEFTVGRSPETQLVSRLNDLTDRIKTQLNDLATSPTQNPESQNQIRQLKQDIDSLWTEIKRKLNELAELPSLENQAQVTELTQKLDDLEQTLKERFDLLQTDVTQELDELTTEITASLSELSKNPPDQLLEKDVEELEKELKVIVTEIKNRLKDLASGKSYKVTQLKRRINGLIRVMNERIACFSPDLSREVQGEMSQLIQILGIAQIELEQKRNYIEANDDTLTDKKVTDLAIVSIKSVVDYVEIALNALNDQPNLVLAQKLRYSARTRLRELDKGWLDNIAGLRDRFFNVLKTPTKVLIGLLVAIPVNYFIIAGFENSTFKGIAALIDYLPTPSPSPTPTLSPSPTPTPSPSPTPPSNSTQTQTDSQKNRDFVILLTMVGALGGAISIFTRLESFQNEKYEDDFLPFFIGAVKPFLGSSFGFFIFILVNSNILPIDLQVNNQESNNSSGYYAILTLAFIAGFSERFVPDLITQVEDKYVPKPQFEKGGLVTGTTVLTIEPSNPTLPYGKRQEFTLNPSFTEVEDYEIRLDGSLEGSPSKGRIITASGTQFLYEAPTQEQATGKTLTIMVTATNNPAMQAKTVVTFADNAVMGN